jgi:hypothetical protein
MSPEPADRVRPRAPIVPLGPVPEAGPDPLRRVVWAFVALGVFLRVVAYAMNYPLWDDEAFLAASFVSRGYTDLLRPLDYGQISPLLFLWGELAAVKLLGFSEWSLRLIPTLSSVAGVFLFAHVSGRVTRGWARALAVGVLAVSYYPIRHGAEVKPYASDLLVALLLLALAVEWWRRPDRVGWLWALVGVVPWAIGLSYPAVFVAGGVTMGLAGAVWAERRRALAPMVVYSVALVLSFLAGFAAVTGVQQDAALATLRSRYWAGAFPPLTRPGALVLWLAEAHTGRMLAHPFGGPSGMSGLTTLCVVAAMVNLRRRREGTLIALAVGPFALALLAALVGRYPYGGSTRTMLFGAPIVCLFTGIGLAVLIARLACDRARQRAARLAVTVLAACGLIVLLSTAVWPYKSLADRDSRNFARWFWSARSREAELVCVKSDLGTGFNRRNWSLFRSALYLCNQKIYSPRHRQGAPFDAAAVTSDHPLRCVLYNEWPEKDPACSAWVEQLRQQFDVVSSETFVVNDQTVHDDGTDIGDRYTVIEFVPRARPAPTGVARTSGAVLR